MINGKMIVRTKKQLFHRRCSTNEQEKSTILLLRMARTELKKLGDFQRKDDRSKVSKSDPSLSGVR